MEDTISQAKAEFIRAKDDLARALATTPDDRINWSPSPTSRTPVQIVAHAAAAVKNIHNFLTGQPFGFDNAADADRSFREWEQRFTTREQVNSLLDQSSGAFVAWLDTVTQEQLAEMIELPFGLGSAPRSAALAFAAAHTRSHVPQIEYIQTIYGDRDWHMPGK